MSLYKNCKLCPRACAVNRYECVGVCGARADVLRIGRAALHWWEEPCLVGEKGSGAIFFAHCSLGCVYCQNKKLAAGAGVDVTEYRLREIMLELQNEQGAANINLVTGTHYAPSIASVLRDLRSSGELTVPVVWNTSGYESSETLELLDGLIDIYLVDFKYTNTKTAKRLSHAEDYPQVAVRSIQQMIAQVGGPEYDEKGYLKKGVIIRHLVLPGYVDDSYGSLHLFADQFKDKALISIMNQFTVVDPNFEPQTYGLEAAVSDEEYERLLDYADMLGLEDYFWQEGGACSESFVPAFDGTGVIPDSKKPEE